MKLILTALITTTIISPFAQAESSDTATFQASIMAFGVPSDIAQEAAKTAISNIEKRQNEESKTQTQESAFANIPDDFITNPYGF